MESNYFIFKEEAPVVDLGNGVSRQILGYCDQLMTVKVLFAGGAIGSVHSHTHVQTTYCASGLFEFSVGSASQVIAAGDSVYIPADAMHGVVCLEEGILIDSFHPVREDFLG